jgi:predicted Zn-dependent protease
MAASLGAMAAAILTGSNAVGQLANIGAQAWMMGYGRENEMEADRLGLKYMTKAGYDPDQFGKVLSLFQAGEKFERARATAEGREPRLYHGVFEPSKSRRARCAGGEGRREHQGSRPVAGWCAMTST